jgi:hypothetical protein
LGDPDQSSGFLFVPIEGGGKNPRIGVWNTEDLSFLSSFELADNTDTKTGGRDLGLPWLAIRPGEDTLWVSHSDDVEHVKVYDILWERLTGTFPPRLVLDNPRLIKLLDRDGLPITLTSVQGGVFNSSGTLLYISTGSCSSHGYIRVFSVDDERSVATLQAQSENGYYPFNFETHPDTTAGFCSGDEAEGLDWLDVRGLNVPGVPDGQLHLVMVNNGIVSCSFFGGCIFGDFDTVYFKHYSGRADAE